MQNDNEQMEQNTDTDYIAAINELKANSVSKDKYEKLKKENKQLLDTLTSGGELETPSPKRSVEELLNSLNDPSISDIEYCKALCELRNNTLEHVNYDPAMPHGHNYQFSQADQDVVDKFFNVVEECIEFADGDTMLFTNELMRRTNDTPAIINNRNNKR